MRKIWRRRTHYSESAEDVDQRISISSEKRDQKVTYQCNASTGPNQSIDKEQHKDNRNHGKRQDTDERNTAMKLAHASSHLQRHLSEHHHGCNSATDQLEGKTKAPVVFGLIRPKRPVCELE